MSERDAKLKRRLWTAAEHAAPDPLERILSACEEPRKEEQQMKNARTTNTIKKRWVSLTAAAMLVKTHEFFRTRAFPGRIPSAPLLQS